MIKMTRHPYVVRKQSSGRTFSDTYIVVRNPGGKRVSTWPHHTIQEAQAAADRLNIGDMVKDYADDPRPYEVRRAEAEANYKSEKDDQR